LTLTQLAILVGAYTFARVQTPDLAQLLVSFKIEIQWLCWQESHHNFSEREMNV